MQKKTKNTMANFDLSSNYNAIETDMDFLLRILDAGFVVFGFMDKSFFVIEKERDNDICLTNRMGNYLYSIKGLKEIAKKRDIRYIKPLNLPAWVENE